MNQEQDPYWHDDIALAEGNIHGEAYAIRLKVHEGTERRWERKELVPVTYDPKRGIPRTYFHGRPYILVPEMTLSLGLYPTPTATGSIGEVLSSTWEGMRQEPIGNTQAWYYPKDRTLILWEAYLDDRYRQPAPIDDETLVALWTGFERFLLERLRDVHQIVTPDWEPVYEEQGERWLQFLEQRGYRRVNERALMKEVDRQDAIWS